MGAEEGVAQQDTATKVCAHLDEFAVIIEKRRVHLGGVV